MVKNINPGSSSSPNLLFEKNGKLYFSADDGTNGSELWVTDGTGAGTLMLKNINPSGSSFISNVLKKDDLFYFIADNGTNSVELWVTDGTSSETKMLKDINPSGASNPTLLTLFNDVIVFKAIDGTNGQELWITDGTNEGTKKFAPDIAPIASPLKNTYNFFLFKNQIYFNAVYGSEGNELFKLSKTSLEANKKDISKINIYPNPAENNLCVSGLSGNYSLKITDMAGKIIFTDNSNYPTLNINLPEYKSGVYILQIVSDTGVFTKKILLK